MVSSILTIGCNYIQINKIEKFGLKGVGPFQPTYNVGGLIDIISYNPASSGTLGPSMSTLLCPMFKEGQNKLEIHWQGQFLANFRLEICVIDVWISFC